MLGSPRKSDNHIAAVDRVREWTRERFSFPRGAVILVAQINCQVPGCPPVETLVAFWGEDETRYRFKLFKPVEQVLNEDLPIYWLLPSLIDYDGLGCDCC